jgi:hypothetical protein
MAHLVRTAISPASDLLERFDRVIQPTESSDHAAGLLP